MSDAQTVSGERSNQDARNRSLCLDNDGSLWGGRRLRDKFIIKSSSAVHNLCKRRKNAVANATICECCGNTEQNRLGRGPQ